MTLKKKPTNSYVLFSTFKSQAPRPLFCCTVLHLESIPFPVYGNVFGFANDFYSFVNICTLAKNFAWKAILSPIEHCKDPAGNSCYLGFEVVLES